MIGQTNLPKIKDVLKKYSIVTTKKLGQNFLFDSNITDKILKYHGSVKDKIVVEIGPGPGLLTRSILACRPKKLIVIEADQRCVAALQDYLLPHYDNLEIIHNDALKYDDYLALGEKVDIIANLPYNISSQLLFKWLTHVDKINKMSLMFQKEVALRIAANPGCRDYGFMSIKSQLLCDVNINFDIAPTEFFPPPKITSTVISLKPKLQPEYQYDLEKLERFCKIAFNQRRKTLKSSTKAAYGDITELLNKLGIDPILRPEQLTLKQFSDISLMI